jgi:hypothetical protein
MKRVALILIACVSAVAVAQPDPTAPPSGGGSAAGSAGSGGAPPPDIKDPWSDPPKQPDPPRPPDPPPPPAGSGSGSGSATGSGSGAGSGSSGSGPVIIKVPTDLNAPQVSAAASPTVVRLGAKFTLFVTATFNAGVEVNLREPLELGPAFEITRKLSEDKPTGDGRTVREWQIEVIAWELGDLLLPPVAVTYTNMGKADQVATNRAKVRVEGVLGDVVDDPKAMRANAPPTDLLARDWFWLYVAIGVVVAITALFAIVAIVRRRRRKIAYRMVGIVGTQLKFDSASDRALYRLKEIEKSGILDDDDTRKKGYAEMVEVIREYIGSRYRVATLDLTSSELIKKLAKLAPQGERDMIERWLERTDIVKYGGLAATKSDAAKTLDDARHLVISTTKVSQAPKDEPPPPPPDPEPHAGGPPKYDPKPKAGPDDDAKTTPFVKEEPAP